MTFKLPLNHSLFTDKTNCVLTSEKWEITTKIYPSGVESLTVANSRGYVEVLPFQGQILWDAVFDGTSLRMENMFSQPYPVDLIEDTYGCFSYHSGLLAGGCPSPEDTHPLHGEFPCAPMDNAWLEIDEETIKIVSSYEYVKGFGNHYQAHPSVKLFADKPVFEIGMKVKNLSRYASMPLQYMCHMNYAFITDGTMSSNLGQGAFQLRRTIPAHVKPTEEWTQINEDILAGKLDANTLTGAEKFDPEIVYFADDLPRYGAVAHFELAKPNGETYFVEFDTAQFPVATRWILHNPDQKVAAFVLPGTSRPEGFLAAQKTGTLIQLAAGQSKEFTVTTGIKE